MFTHQLGGVDGSGKGRIGSCELDGKAFQSRLLQVKTRPLRVVDVHRFRIDGVLHGRGQRIVVAGAAMTEHHLFQDLLPVDGILQGQTHVDVGEGGDRTVHGGGVMRQAGDVRDLHLRIALQQVEGFQVAAVHVMDVAGIEGGCAGHHVVDDQQLHGVEPGGAVIAGIAHRARALTRAEGLQPVGACADTGLPVQPPVIACRKDRQMIVGEQVGEIGVGIFQLEGHAIFAIGAHVRDDRQHRLHGRFGLLSHMMTDACQHVR